MKIREWCSLKGIRQEIKNIHWLTKKELAYNSFVVLVFCFLFGVYFYLSDTIIALILRALGMN
ncbi:MAG: preprotein translocase subunit SecE [Erysipelotrichaceae bacterium]|nr:preprotein translocase subunit SecE [Erysipelotrichaceae bacterium]